MQKKLWFKQKRFGFGWTPCSKEGWLVILGFLAALALVIYYHFEYKNEKDVTSYLIDVFVLVAILIFISYKKGEKLTFRKTVKKSSVYMCPQCSSTNWKFPDPLKFSESMVNTPGMVNNLLECKKCSYVGVFFQVDKDKIKEVKHTFKR